MLGLGTVSFVPYLLPSARGAFYSAQDTGKALGEAGEGRGLPGKWSLNEALPCAVAFLGLINISGMCLYLNSPGLIQNPRRVTCLGAFQLCNLALAKALTFVINMTCF